MMSLIRAFLGDAFIAAFAVFVVAAVAGAAVFLNLTKDGARPITVVVKGLASLQFFILGLAANIVYGGKSTNYIVIALALGLSGDVFLEVSEATVKPKTWFFVLGTLFFAAEHVLIAVNLIIANTEIWLPSLIFFAVSYSVVIITVLSTKPVANKRMLALGLSYFVLVCVMGGCCFGTAVTSYNEGNLSLMIGGIFFIISDALLAVYRFSKPEKFSLNTALIYFYYAAQLFIASSIYFAAE
ncbi:MAG: hypothetical protein HP008_04455 [Clostridia bacterium]|nr:hypothetical protein [Clostridia bacterium]